jgi:hypothetical protein
MHVHGGRVTCEAITASLRVGFAHSSYLNRPDGAVRDHMSPSNYTIGYLLFSLRQKGYLLSQGTRVYASEQAKDATGVLYFPARSISNRCGRRCLCGKPHLIDGCPVLADSVNWTAHAYIIFFWTSYWTQTCGSCLRIGTVYNADVWSPSGVLFVSGMGAREEGSRFCFTG